MAEAYCTGTMTDGSRAVFRIEQPMGSGFMGRVVSRTPDGVPSISNVHPRVTAVVGCNGSLAKSGDTIGRVAVEFV